MSLRDLRIVMSAGLGLAAAAVVQAAPDTAPQAATPQAGQLQEVIVTAEKRSESEQTVPMSITTFSAQALQQKAITNFFDYATKVPNLAFAPTGDGVGTARTVSIRGISGDNVTGFYIDDVPLPDSIRSGAAVARHRSHRGTARPAGHAVWGALHGWYGQNHYQGTGTVAVFGDGARGYLGHGTYRPAQPYG